ncbi:16S rRNA (guanine(527)-N(7))-methyltransferase RsmG [Aurantiacibacter aquimixticola]|uniref:Ribosomal RNA small subunit methyltransferase G n=1 Tax=Aurantiacibacter aquimixticola TaxID=1958945 RepID=A0A419RUY2_9SPHN|nr:16S rRNA (guanine(527)-N(7))-methyltransferase RsmG [Aurantiacibacter aquimixticola]RJY09580.1 16S rRNA (guanine(527)-N(7))-methyltransferase RsmG [Aurantiacibacter aquimixticola]
MIESEDEARAYCAARCDDRAMGLLERFVHALCEENGRQNLISKASVNHVWQRHIADSLQLVDHAPQRRASWLDLGSGPGLPGIVIAIARPDVEMHCVESRAKRIAWLERICVQLDLENCLVHGRQLERVESREMDVITARAFAPLAKLLDLSERFSTPATVWLLPKGRSAAQELAEQPNHVRGMFHVEQSMTSADAAILVGKGRIP